jgi:colicin import membrane protein
MNELIAVEKLNALQVFSDGGLDPVIERIEQEARSILLDISTEKGRKEIASLAYKIAQSKTTLDKMGKDLASGWKEQAKKVDQERARVWDRLELLQKEIRSPLTEWENKEKDRIANHERALADISALAVFSDEPSVAEIERRIARSVEISGARSWEEFTQRAKLAHEQTYDALVKKLEARKQYEAQQAELTRLRREEEERKRREHEERIAREAAEQARKAAEEKARKEAEAEAARVRAEQERAEQERLRIRREKGEAEARARKAEADRKAAEEKAERDKIAAAEQARKAAELAVTRERERIEAEQRAEAEATAKREADKRHKAKINGEILAALVAAGIADDHAKKAIEAIAKGLIPHVIIRY